MFVLYDETFLHWATWIFWSLWRNYLLSWSSHIYARCWSVRPFSYWIINTNSSSINFCVTHSILGSSCIVQRLKIHKSKATASTGLKFKIFTLFKEVKGKTSIMKVFLYYFLLDITIPTFPSKTTWTFCNGPNLENSLSSSRSVVYKLRPNTPRQVPSSGFSRLPTCLLLADIGDLL